MAAGGAYKGNGNGNRGRPYGLMLLLAFGAALLGVMMLHKFREKRIFNLLIKEKDRELMSLQLILQKERERSKEMKRKTEEMKTKIYSLRTQKMELDRRQLEMQSTINSIKDEQKVMESEFEEKQNEIKMLRETNIDAEKENLQMAALTESLKQKEAEIEDLKHHLAYRAKIWSVSTDDPSSPSINMTLTTNMVDRDNIEVEKSKEEVVQLHETANDGNGLNSTRDDEGKTTSTNLEKQGDTAIVENAGESRLGITDRREVSEEKALQKHEGSRNGSSIGIENDQGYENGSSQGKGASGAGEENNTSTATEKIVRRIGRASKTADAHNDEKSTDREHKFNVDEKPVLENVQETEDRQGTFRSGVELETVDNSRRRGKERSRHDSRVRGRGTVVARNRLLENRNHENKVSEKMINRKFPGDDQGRLIYREEGRASIDGKTEEITKAEDSSDAKSMEHQNREDSIDRTNLQMSEVHATMKRLPVAHEAKEMTNGSLDGQLSNIRSNDKKQSLDEYRQHEDQQAARGMQESRNSSNMNKENRDEQVKITSKHERQEKMEDSDVDHETDAGAGDFYKESVSDSEEDKEEYRDETDESNQ